MKKQSKDKYSSLMNRIALVLLVSCLLIYFFGRVVSFARSIIIVAEGYNIFADLVFLILGCVVDFLSVYFIPVKIFKYLQGNAFREKNMPVEQNILGNDVIVPVFVLGLCSSFVGYAVNSSAVNLFTEYSGFGEDYLFLSGMKYGYQIVIYIISIAIIPAVFEELIFRKTLCDALSPYGPKTAIIVTAILFSLMHTNFSRILHTFVMGLFCAWLYIGTKNIKIPMLLHFLNNLLAGIETVIAYRVSTDAAATFMTGRFFIFLIVSVVCFVRLRKMRQNQLLSSVREARENNEYEAYIEKKRKYANYIEMLPDENGEEVTSLSKQDKISGFFSPAMILFIVLVIIQMFYWLSFELV